MEEHPSSHIYLLHPQRKNIEFGLRPRYMQIRWLLPNQIGIQWEQLQSQVKTLTEIIRQSREI